jgi:hypothetical protein
VSQSNVLIPPVTGSLRVLGAELYPTYMNGPVWSSYLYSINVCLDAVVDSASYAVRARFPQLAPFDALPWLAQDRQIFQGPSETSASYVARLLQWLDLWRLAGNPTSVLLAFLAWLTPLTPQVQTVTSWAGASPGTVWQTYVAGSTPFPPGQTIPTPPNLLTVATANWDWDGASQPYYFPWMRWRTWVIVSSFAGSPWAAPTQTWGNGQSWGDGVSCYGWTGTAQQSAQLTALAKTWKSGGTWVPWIVVNYDNTWFLETGVTGTRLPDGTWGYYGKIVADATYGTKYVSARPPASTCTLVTGTNDGGGVLGAG